MERATSYGTIVIDEEVLRHLAVQAIPGEVLGRPELKAEGVGRGVIVTEANGGYGIDLYLSVPFGSKLAEIGDVLGRRVGDQLFRAIGALPRWITVHVEKVTPPDTH